MLKKLTSLLLVVLMLSSFAACNNDEVKHKTGWQNQNETVSSEETTENTLEETTTQKTTEVSVTSEPEISFSEKKALTVGTLNSEIYGPLSVYFQDGYFLLFDEYKDRKFTVYAQGYSAKNTDGKAVALFDDMNFDGYTDFGVCYYKDSLNSYFFCFLWDNSIRNFTYYLPLSSLANPDFDPVTKSVTAYERLTVSSATEKKYGYSSDTLSLLSSKNVTDETVTNGAETVNANLQITESGTSATLTLNTNKNSHSKWVCSIENENVVTLGSEYYNEEVPAYEFTLVGIAPGATTVIFRYTSVFSGEYIEEIIVNVITNGDSTIKIVVPE